MKLLLQNGANVNAVSKSNSKSKGTPLHVACMRNRTDAVKLLIQHGANVNSTNSDLETPLHRAAWYGLDEISKVLLENGADCNATTRGGERAFQIACDRGHPILAMDLAKGLKKNGSW